MPLPYKGSNIPLAKNLRTNATPQENKLWYRFLSKYKLRFQRQKAIGDFIADFYCFKAKLVIEIDGSQHFEQAAQVTDAVRTEYLESHNLTVVRFTNKQINENFTEVCQYIDYIVDKLIEENKKV